MLDLKIPEHSYFYGFMLADGHLRETTRNRGRLSLEIGEVDRDIIFKFEKLFPKISHVSSRTRDTNFKENSTSYILNIHNWDFREEIKALGYIEGCKTEEQDVPNSDYCEIDFIRGLIDANGSVGFIKGGIPFVSFTTKSDYLKEYFLSFIMRELGISKICNKNKRDNIYNILVSRNNAKKLYGILYYKGCLCLKRKKVDAILNWESKFSERTVRYWTEDEVLYIQNNSIEDSIIKLNRNRDAIRSKLNKLGKVV